MARIAVLQKKSCIIYGCKDRTFAAGLCHSHYEQASRFGKAIPHIIIRCFVPTCSKTFIPTNINSSFTLCTRHSELYRDRKRMGLPTTYDSLVRRVSTAGYRNPRWNGGISEYPDHYIFKLVRKVVLERAKNLCKCGRRAWAVHHINDDKSDHRVKNLRAMCQSCHLRLHHSKHSPTSKFRRKFGRTLKEIGIKYGVCGTTIYDWFRRYPNWVPGKPKPTYKNNKY